MLRFNMMSYIFIYIILTNIIDILSIIEPIHNSDEVLSSCLKLITEKYLESNNLVTIIHRNGYNTTNHFLVLKYTEKTVIPYFVINTAVQISRDLYKEKSDCFIIFASNGIELNVILEKVHTANNWDAYAKIIVVSERTDQQSELIKVLHNWLLHSSVVLAINDDLECVIHVWRPINLGSCAGNTHTITRSYYTANTTEFSTDLFATISEEWYNGCTLKIRTRHYGPFIVDPYIPWPNTTDQYSIVYGIDAILMNIIGGYLNITMQYGLRADIDYTFGALYTNGSSSGPVSYLFNKKVDVLLGGGMMNDSLMEVFTGSQGYFSDGFKFCGPYPSRKSSIRTILEILEVPVYISMVVSFVLYYIQSRLLFKYGLLNEHSLFGAGAVWMYFFATMICYSSNLQPKSLTLRTLCFIWIVFALILSTAFQSLLFRALVKPFYEEFIDTLEQALHNNLLLFLAEGTYESYSPDDPRLKHLLRYSNSTDYFEKFDRVLQARDAVMTTPSFLSEYLKKEYHNVGVEIHCMKEQLFQFYRQMFSRKGFLLMPVIDTSLQRLIEGGFISRWVKDYKYVLDIPIEMQPLSFSHMEPAFVVLVIGVVFASIAFCLEFVYYKRHRK